MPLLVQCGQVQLVHGRPAARHSHSAWFRHGVAAQLRNLVQLQHWVEPSPRRCRVAGGRSSSDGTDRRSILSLRSSTLVTFRSRVEGPPSAAVGFADDRPPPLCVGVRFNRTKPVLLPPVAAFAEGVLPSLPEGAILAKCRTGVCVCVCVTQP